MIVKFSITLSCKLQNYFVTEIEYKINFICSVTFKQYFLLFKNRNIRGRHFGGHIWLLRNGGRLLSKVCQGGHRKQTYAVSDFIESYDIYCVSEFLYSNQYLISEKYFKNSNIFFNIL